METPASSLPLRARVAIVTGASRNVGQAITVCLRSLGAKAVINYSSNSPQADQLVARLNTFADSASSP